MVATLADAVLLALVHRAFGAADGRLRTGLEFTQLSPRYGVAWLVLAVLYYVRMEAYLGRTLGTMLMRIQVVDAVTGLPPGLGKAAVRTAARVIDGGCGYLVALVVVVNSRQRRRIGDMLAHTLVVRRP
ncbi:RDD family protein [Cryptosporangium arvum]|uniref:RDD family protein n=1 Tax=Cryptosporangium arvum TaxID=80871 RepID=UPI0004B1D446|nr:RDD family protein [Cryptosporangium arvum]